MKPTTILALQSLGIAMQIINTGIATTHANPVLVLVIGACVGGFQFFLQRVGNQADPNAEATALKKSAGAA